MQTGETQRRRDGRLRRSSSRCRSHHLVGGATHAQHERLLRRRTIDHRVPERSRARRRLHERRQFPRHRRSGRAVGIRRPDLLDRVSGRLAGGDVPDRRAAAQSRQVHVQRRGRVSAAAGAGARGRGGRQPGGGRVLSDRADGRRRQPDPAAVRPQLRGGGRDRRARDARLRALRRHDRHHVGADRQGGAAAGRRVHAGDDGAGEVLVQSAGALRRSLAPVRRRRARAGPARVGSDRRASRWDWR